MRTNLAIAAAAVLSACLYLALSSTGGGIGFPLDDAWIHQTYARNLARLGEWSFLPHQPSAGSTSPCWTATLALGYWLGIDGRVWAYASGVVLLALTGMAAGTWIAERQAGSHAWRLAAGVLIALEWQKYRADHVEIMVYLPD